MRQPVQRAHAILVQNPQGIIKEAFDARLEIIHRRIDQRDDQNFLPVLQLVILDNLRGKRGENVRLASARHGGNSKPPASVAEDFFLRGAGDERGGYSHGLKISAPVPSKSFMFRVTRANL